MDYIFFFYGLSFILLSAVCIFLRNESDERPAWLWLGLFGLTHGLNEWLDMLALTFSDGLLFTAFRTAFMALSFLFLLEFGRRTLRSSGAKAPGIWIYAPLLALASAGQHYGFNGVNASARYALGLTGGFLSSLAMYRAASEKPARLRTPLLAISAGFGIYALATGAVAPESAMWPARWINYGTFTRAFGFPVQLLRGLLAMFIAMWAWTYLLNLGELRTGGGARPGRKARVGWASIAAIVLTIAAGWVITDALGSGARQGIGRDSENLKTILVNRLKDSLLGVERTGAAIAGSPLIPEALTAVTPASVARANSELDHYCSSFDLSVCYILDLKGVAIASSNRKGPKSLVGKNYSFRPYFSEAADGRSGQYFALGVTTGERGYYASYPIKKDGLIVGVAVAKKSVDFLAKELQLFTYSFIVSPEGVIFISSQPNLLFRSLWPAAPAVRESLLKSKQFGRPDFNSLVKTELKDDDIIDFSGGRFYISRAPFKQKDWSLITFNSLQYVQVTRFAGILITFTLCMLLLVFFITLVQSETAREAAENLLRLKEEVTTLSGILPICAGCKKIRDDKGYWTSVETYISEHSQTQFTHGLCLDCATKLYPEYADKLTGARDKPGSGKT